MAVRIVNRELGGVPGQEAWHVQAGGRDYALATYWGDPVGETVAFPADERGRVRDWHPVAIRRGRALAELARRLDRNRP